MRKKTGLLVVTLLLTICVVMLMAPVAMAAVTGSETGYATGAGGTSPGTGAPLLVLGAVGAAMAGAGMLLRRRG